MNIIALNNNNDFKRVYKLGKSVVTETFVFYYLENDIGVNRIGFTVTKKLGNAVHRNRMRRRLKESFYRNYSDKIKNHDIVVVARKNSYNCSFDKIDNSMKEVLSRW